MCEITLLWGEIAALSGKQFVTLAWMMTHIDYYELLIVVIIGPAPGKIGCPGTKTRCSNHVCALSLSV